MNIVVFRGYHSPCFPGAAKDKLRIQGFNGKHIHYPCLDILLRQFFSRLQSPCHFNAAGDYRNVISLSYDISLSDLNLFVSPVIGFSFLALKPDVLYAPGRCHLSDNLPQKIGFRHIHNRYIGISAVNPHIFKGHMGSPVCFCRYARIRTDDFQIGIVIAARQKSLVRHSSGRKGTKGMYKGDLSFYGHSRSHANHIGFHNPQIKSLTGKFPE